VFISRGLLAHLSNEAEVAAVLGHEIGHVTGRHVDERISRATAVELGLALGGAMTESQVAQMVGGLFGQGYLLSFGREQELEADRLGLRYMTEAGYDPHAMLGVLRVLMESRGPGGGPPEILSTHPNPERRLELVQNLLDQEYSHTRDNPEFRLFEGRFRQNAAPHVGARTASLGAIAEGKRPRCCPH
jgi:beta-barrel assembly-enhancing protease